MLSVQLGAALSTRLFDVVGPAGTAWLRLAAGAVIFLALVRPDLRTLRPATLPVPLALGVVTGVTTVAFLSAIDRIPLGTAVAVEFLGPLGVAVARSRDRRSLLWPVLALAGVLLLTRPWTGEVDVAGLLLAALAACGWAAYILLTQVVGDRYAGIDGLAFTIPVAALVATVVGLPQAAGHVDGLVVLQSFGLALLLPVIPYALEMLALRRLTTAAFGTLMSLEPAFGVLVGAVVLAQHPSAAQAVGVALVVVAGIGAERTGHREAPVPELVVPPGVA